MHGEDSKYLLQELKPFQGEILCLVQERLVYNKTPFHIVVSGLAYRSEDEACEAG